ncbi:MAG: hypothetical protein JXR96_00970 [Deltaproteobacteria bacterium]|nr:hypothetical protein [Deltaproteobacteria bacterium]
MKTLRLISWACICALAACSQDTAASDGGADAVDAASPDDGDPAPLGDDAGSPDASDGEPADPGPADDGGDAERDGGPDDGGDLIPDGGDLIPDGGGDSADGETDAGGDSAAAYPPDEWGPFDIGVRKERFYDADRNRWLETLIWYPAVPHGPEDSKIRYFLLLEGNGYEDLAVDTSEAPYPLVLFSHGNKGVNFQSFSFTSYLASHGFFVAACNHSGNTMFENPDDQEMAQIALDRPIDIAFVLTKLTELAGQTDDPFHGCIDVQALGMSGHSFGGYTALVVSGGVIDVDAARQRCEAGSESDVFCPYIRFWPAGQQISRPAELSGVLCGLAMAPGGYGAFGDDGLAEIHTPTMIMAGLIDEWMPIDVEPRPIYDALSPPAYKLEIDQAGHMNFTDICRIPLNQLIPDLAEMCDPDIYLDVDRSYEMIQPFSVAFFRKHLRGETAMDAYLSSAYADNFVEASFERK